MLRGLRQAVPWIELQQSRLLLGSQAQLQDSVGQFTATIAAVEARQACGDCPATAACQRWSVRQYCAQQAPPGAGSLFIETAPTPNPASMMFIPGRKVMQQGNAEFTNTTEAQRSPLAASLFALSGVTRVFYGSDFVTVTKGDDVQWPTLKQDVFAALRDFYQSGQDLFVAGAAEELQEIDEDEDETVAMIKELLDTRIRPVVQEDGGDVQFRSFDPASGTVELKLQGACSGCPSSSVTLKNGIEEMLKYYIKDVYHVVEAGLDESEQAGVNAFKELESRLST